MVVVLLTIGVYLVLGHAFRRTVAKIVGVGGCHWIDVSSRYFAATTWKQVAVGISGPFFTYTIVAILHGVIAAQPLSVPTLTLDPMPGLAAHRAGVRTGDIAISADGVPLSTWGDLVETVQQSSQDTIELVVFRKQEHLAVEIARGVDRRIGVRTVHERWEPGVMKILHAAFVGPWKHTAAYAVTAASVFGLQKTEVVGGPVVLADLTGQSEPQSYLPVLAFSTAPAMPIAILADICLFALLVRGARARKRS